MISLLDLKTAPRDVLNIVPFGGVGEFGINCTGYVFRGKLYIVDCGLIFSPAVKLGTDSLIPDLDQALTDFGGVEAYMITHGHEDHIGSLPFLLQKWPAPIYCTAWTKALIDDKLNRMQIDRGRCPIHVVEAGDTVRGKDISFQYFHVNHSIPMACALVIECGGMRVFHTGDFKIDPTPIGESKIRFDAMSELGKKGVDLLIADSTNATTPGNSLSEKSVFDPLRAIIAEAERTVFVTTFSSNLWRLVTIAEICKSLGKKIHGAGSGIMKTLKIAAELNLYPFDSNLYVDEDQLAKVPPEDLVVVATGCQGESRAAIPRMVNGEHPVINVVPGDVIVFSSRIIPGNELSVNEILNRCAKNGIHVITPRTHPGIHVSGHACQEDLVEFIDRLRPKSFMPVHGTFPHLVANEMLATFNTMHKPDIISIENGMILTLSPQGCTLTGPLDINRKYVESWSRLTISPLALRERLRIGDSGLALLNGVYSQKEGNWLVKPDYEVIGLEFPERVNIGNWKDRAMRRIIDVVDRESRQKGVTKEDLNESARLAFRRELIDVFIKKPVVISKIHFI